MLPTFVVGLREGLEAALIVGIIAAFLSSNGRRDALRQVWLGVLVAIVLCLLIGIGLLSLSRELPQRGQEALETVIGLLAVGMVSYMIVWMNSHAREMRRQLESQTAVALAAGSAFALVAMAFLAVLREGFETAVFLLAVIQNSTSATAGAIGAFLGIAISAAFGYAIYRGGARLNMKRFFRITSVVLVIVAAGLLMTVAHTAHEAGWLAFGQATVADLSPLVRPGTVLSSLVTGVLGLQPQPVVLEVTVWVLYAVPMLAYVLWPRTVTGKSAAPAATAEPAVAETSKGGK